MYYIYHIPKRKEWGCTKFLEQRIKRLGYLMCDVDRIILVSNENKASDMERDLNIEYGYGWNSSKDYRRVNKMASLGGKIVGKRKDNIERLKKIQKEAAILGGLKQGKIQGKKNSESGMLSNLGKKMAEYNNRIQTCIHCGKTTRGIGYTRWHGDKCKHKIVK